MAIAVIGLGKLGLPIAACFASAGHKVIGADTDTARMEAIKRGECPVDEPGLADLLRGNGKIECAPVDVAVRMASVIFIVVPTPSLLDHTFSTKHVVEVCEEIAGPISAGGSGYSSRVYRHVVVTSTVMPGATGGEIRRALEKWGAVLGRDYNLVYSPEFVALGSVIKDFTHPDFLLLGESGDASKGDKGTEYSPVVDAYRSVCRNEPWVIRTNWVNAEIAKLALNTYVTGKITFANTLAEVCEKFPDANVDDVSAALGRDSRIGEKYLKGGASFGGPCFPRDVRAFSLLSESASTLGKTVEFVNFHTARRVVDMVDRMTVPGGRVHVIGMPYKSGTVIEEESMGTRVATMLAARGFVVDCVRMEGEMLPQPDAVVLALPGLDCLLFNVDETAPGRKVNVVDCWRAYPNLSNSPRVNYVAIGVGTEKGTEKGREQNDNYPNAANAESASDDEATQAGSTGNPSLEAECSSPGD